MEVVWETELWKERETETVNECFRNSVDSSCDMVGKGNEAIVKDQGETRTSGHKQVGGSWQSAKGILGLPW